MGTSPSNFLLVPKPKHHYTEIPAKSQRISSATAPEVHLSAKAVQPSQTMVQLSGQQVMPTH
eukprot:4663961-Amphidinium_carterae.1